MDPKSDNLRDLLSERGQIFRCNIELYSLYTRIRLGTILVNGRPKFRFGSQYTHFLIELPGSGRRRCHYGLLRFIYYGLKK